MHPSDRRSSLLSAVLQTLAEVGPNPTSFKASPAADYIADGYVNRSAPGWWVTYACLLEITSHTVEDAGHLEDLVSLRFDAGEDVHNGEPWVWELTYGMEHGERRLVLRDHATYPEPWRHVLQYHAIGRCRDTLLERAAARLGQQQGVRNSLSAAVAAIAAVFVSSKASPSAAAQAPPPMWRPPDKRTETKVWRPPDEVEAAEAAWAAAPATTGSLPFAWAVKTSASGARSHLPFSELGTRSSGVVSFHVLDETPRVAQMAAVGSEDPDSSRPFVMSSADVLPPALAAAEAFASVSVYMGQPTSPASVSGMTTDSDSWR
jgi:hypothetical protein